MAQFAYFRLEHSSFNRKDWGYGRVAAHAHYGANQNKRGHVATVGIPICRTSYEVEREVLKLEKLTTRKNGRTGDTMIVSLPKEVDSDHRLLMMERFLSKVTFEGRTYAQAWEHIDKPDNPHFHVVVIDRDRVSGESVGKFGHSRSWREKHGMEPNVTEWIRKQWEDTGNEIFKELGYDLRFDRRNWLERGVEPPGVHRGPQPDNQNEPPKPQQEEEEQTPETSEEPKEAVTTEEPVSPDTPVALETDADKPEVERATEEIMVSDDPENAGEGLPLFEYERELREAQDAVLASSEAEVVPEVAEDAAPSNQPLPDEDLTTPAYLARWVRNHDEELNYLRHMRERLSETRDRIAFLHQEREALEKEREKQFEDLVIAQGTAYAARHHMEMHQRKSGALKGVRITVRLLKMSYATDKRLRAEAAERRAREREWAAQHAENVRQQYEYEMARMNARLKDAYEAQESIRNELIGPDGSMEDISQREKDLLRVMHFATRKHGFTSDDVWQAYENGEINIDELEAYAKYSNSRRLKVQGEMERDKLSRGQRL